MSTLARLAAFQRPTIAARDRRPEGTEGNRGFTVTNTTDGGAEIWLYDEIGGWGIWAQDVVDQLQQITASTITVRVSSPGGDVFDGIAIANALASHPAHVTVQVDSLAASIASVIAVSAGDRILMAPNSQMMIHNASGGCRGEAGDMRKMADLLDKIGAVIAQRTRTVPVGTSPSGRP